MSERQCRHVKLSKPPLMLVLAQVRLSPVRQLARFIPSIQEEFRLHGLPIERAGRVQQLVVSSTGMQLRDVDRWEYRSPNERESVTLFEDSVVLQTTDYLGFEAFADRLERCLRTVLEATEQQTYGRILRIGLRYLDLVQPGEGESFRDYLRPGLHGIDSALFLAGSQRLHVECVGRTRVGELEGTLVVRILQNDQGFDLPPDLIAAAPAFESRARPGELATLIDIDHFVEVNEAPDVGWIRACCFDLHDAIIESFHEQVVSEHAIEVWSSASEGDAPLQVIEQSRCPGGREYK